MARPPRNAPPPDQIARLVGKDGCVTIRATPNARVNSIRLDPAGHRLLVAITATPEDGKANDAILALLAAALDRPKSSLTLVSGATGRDKRIHVG